jgi:hypothetical protein
MGSWEDLKMATTLRRSSSSYGGFADGLIIRQMPLVTVYGGNVYWVDSNGGGASKGTFKSPVATLDAAMALCTADNGDTIMIKAGHTETVTGAGAITLAKGGMSIHGLGNYTARPTFLLDGSTGVTGLVTGDNITITNCVFSAGHAAILCAFLCTGVGFTMDSCAFVENTTAEDFVAVFNGGAAHNDYDGLTFSNNVMDFTTGGTAVLSPFNLLFDSKDVNIIGNKFLGDFDTSPHAPIYSVNTVNHMNIEIAYNLIHNQHDADEEVGIYIGSATSTGWMHHNLVAAFDDTGATPFLAAAGGIAVFENYYIGDVSTSGYILPAIGSG